MAHSLYRKQLDGSPSKGIIPLPLAFAQAHHQAAGLFEKMQVRHDCPRLVIRCQSSPERIKRSRIAIIRAPAALEVVVEKKTLPRVPQILFDCDLARLGERVPVRGFGIVAEEPAHGFKITLGLEKQGIEAYRGIVVGESTEGTEPE